MNLYIKSMKRDAATGIVKSILWVASKVSDGEKFRATAKGEQFLQQKQVNDPSFIAYSDISLDVAEKWLRDSFGESGLESMEEYLNAVLAQQASQSEVLGNPWQPVVDVAQTSTPPAQPSRRTNFPIAQS
jgi:hypothetical protein